VKFDEISGSSPVRRNSYDKQSYNSSSPSTVQKTEKMVEELEKKKKHVVELENWKTKNEAKLTQMEEELLSLKQSKLKLEEQLKDLKVSAQANGSADKVCYNNSNTLLFESNL
jgi:uncharacterized protein (DUF342 family)